MAGIQGSTGPVAGPGTIAWPAGTTAAMYALFFDEDGRRPDGWREIASHVYAKRLTAGDIASPLPIRGVAGLAVFSLAGGHGRVRSSEWCRAAAGGVCWWFGWQSPYSSGVIADATYQRGSTVADPDDGWKHAMFARAVASGGDYSPGGVSRRAEWVSVEILPLASPLSPLWLTTSGQSVDRTQAFQLSVQHQSAAGADMDGLRVEIRVAAGTWQHLAANGTIVAGSQELVNDTGRVTIAANQLTANTTYELRAYTHDEGGWSPASGSLTLVARTPPTVAPTLTTAANDLTPNVTWTTTPGLGSQVTWEARIAPAGAGPDAYVPGWASGPQAGTETAWAAPVPTVAPVNGGSYEPWLRVRDGALTSAWTTGTAKTVSWTPPTAPASITPTQGAPFSIVAGGVPATSLALEYEHETETDVWEALTVKAGPSATDTVIIPHAPYGVARRYRVRSVESIDGVRLPSAWRTSTAVANLDEGSYLISEDGTRWAAAEVVTTGTLTPVQGRSVTRGMGATHETVRVTPVTGWRSWWQVRTHTLAALDALMDDWLTVGSRFRLRSVPEYSWEGGPLVDVPPVMVAVTAVDEPERPVDLNVSERLTRFEFTTQEG